MGLGKSLIVGGAGEKVEGEGSALRGEPREKEVGRGVGQVSGKI